MIKILKIGGFTILGIIVLTIVLGLIFGKSEELKTEITESSKVEVVIATSSTFEINQIPLNDFIAYAESSEGGAFKMQQRAGNAHSYVGLSEDDLNGLELIENNGIVEKAITYSIYSPYQDQRQGLTSLTRLITIPGYPSGKNVAVADWIVEQMKNLMKQDAKSNFIAETDINNKHCKITRSQDGGFVKTTVEISYQ